MKKICLVLVLMLIFSPCTALASEEYPTQSDFKTYVSDLFPEAMLNELNFSTNSTVTKEITRTYSKTINNSKYILDIYNDGSFTLFTISNDVIIDSKNITPFASYSKTFNYYYYGFQLHRLYMTIPYVVNDSNGNITISGSITPGGSNIHLVGCSQLGPSSACVYGNAYKTEAGIDIDYTGMYMKVNLYDMDNPTKYLTSVY